MKAAESKMCIRDRSYGVRACGYLLKPYLYEDFARTMDLAGLDKVRSARFIRMEEEKILLHEILWCDRDEHYIQVHTDKRGILRFRNSFKMCIRDSCRTVRPVHTG